MNCNCIKRLEGEIAAAPFVKAKAGENIKVTCTATGFQMTDDMNLKLVINIPFRIRGTGKGFTSEKGKEMPVVASFCPFCGVSTKAATPVTDQPAPPGASQVDPSQALPHRTLKQHLVDAGALCEFQWVHNDGTTTVKAAYDKDITNRVLEQLAFDESEGGHHD